VEEIFIPASGMAAEDVLVSEWLKEPGDQVAIGEPVAVVETDKATVELSGTTAGRLSRHLVEAGARVPGGTTVAYLLEDGESEPGNGDGSPPPAKASLAASSLPDAEDEVRSRGVPEPTSPPEARRSDGRHTLSPRQRRALAEPAPSGASSTADPGVAAVAKGPSTAEALSTNRQATAALVTESWRSVPHFSVGRELRADGLDEAVSATRAAGTSVTVTDFLVLALARAINALGEVPDVGLAVATEWGVLIPVLRSVAGLSLAEVATAREAAVSRARSRRLGSADAAPAFATLSNLGPAGVSWFTGVVPVNQVALVTVGEVSLRPAVEGRGLVVAPMFTAVVTADHRRYDGADSARLLSTFADELGKVIKEALK
jgi:pyruvate dehydrogenase E2 component (dihydrolipoamide acetyltransferase)